MKRTTLNLPDSVFRQLKAKAALEGTTLEALLGVLVTRGLRAKPRGTAGKAEARFMPPSIKLGRPLTLSNPSNASLFELL